MTEQERTKLLKAATAFYRVSYCRAEHERTLRDLQDDVYCSGCFKNRF